MRTVSELLDVARQELGSTESPAGSNRTKYGKWMGLDGQPWCMSFVQWCCAQIGQPLPFRTGSCSALLAWYKQNKPECIVEEPRPGDIIIYNFGHTGFVERVQSGTVIAIEGNTSAGDSGSQDNGGGVFRRTRKQNLVKAYIRPYEEDMGMTIDEIVAGMTDKQAYDLLEKAKRYAASLPEPDWSKEEGHWTRAEAAGVLKGKPEGLVKRDELAAVMGRSGLLGK